MHASSLARSSTSIEYVSWLSTTVACDIDLKYVQEVRKGFTWGSVTIVPLQAEEEEDTRVVESTLRTWGPNDCLRIPFQNENLYVIRESPGQPDEVRNSIYAAELSTDCII